MPRQKTPALAGSRAKALPFDIRMDEIIALVGELQAGTAGGSIGETVAHVEAGRVAGVIMLSSSTQAGQANRFCIDGPYFDLKRCQKIHCRIIGFIEADLA